MTKDVLLISPDQTLREAAPPDVRGGYQCAGGRSRPPGQDGDQPGYHYPGRRAWQGAEGEGEGAA
jgi:hypothetical protein